MGRVSKPGAAAGSNRRPTSSTQQQLNNQPMPPQPSLGQPVPSLFPDDLSALLRRASAGERRWWWG